MTYKISNYFKTFQRISEYERSIFQKIIIYVVIEEQNDMYLNFQDVEAISEADFKIIFRPLLRNRKALKHIKIKEANSQVKKTLEKILNN